MTDNNMSIKIVNIIISQNIYYSYYKNIYRSNNDDLYWYKRNVSL